MVGGWEAKFEHNDAIVTALNIYNSCLINDRMSTFSSTLDSLLSIVPQCVNQSLKVKVHYN